MEKIVKVFPAWDKRNSNPHKNYGINPADMIFVLKGELGAVDFCMNTGWHLPHVKKELEVSQVKRIQDGDTQFPFLLVEGRGSSLGWHSRIRNEDYEIERHDCEYTGGTCYSDVSYSSGDELFNILVQFGTESLWKRLEQEYINAFGELK